jgi:hypothetical protein
MPKTPETVAVTSTTTRSKKGTRKAATRAPPDAILENGAAGSAPMAAHGGARVSGYLRALAPIA